MNIPLPLRASALRASPRFTLALLAAGLLASTTSIPARAQDAAKKEKSDSAKKAKDPKGEKKVPTLYTSETPIALTFRTNIKQIRKDKGETPPWRWATLSYQDSANKTVDVPVKVRTRGIWRLKHCEFPLLRLDFDGKVAKHTLLDKLGKPKLVSYCRNHDQYEQYVLQELQL